MNTTPDRDELFRLFGALSNETLTAPEQARLEELLSGSAEARGLWFLYCDMERGLARRKPAAVREPLFTAPVPSTRRSRPFRVPWAWAMAASVVFVALLGSLLFFSSGTASAAAVVQRALKAHAALLDRCYRVEVRGAARAVVPRRQESLLWTRGDRFWNQIEADGKSVAWGRDESGGVWFALSRKEGARLAANEVPEALAQACELRSLELESLLRTILADFDLRREPASSGADVIHAELKADTVSKYRSALLEVDAESGVLRRVELHREHQGRVVAVISAALVESSLQDETNYTLEGHLDADAGIYERENGRGHRGRLLMNFLDLVRVRSLP
jgi:hypothetical protein